MHGLGDTCDGWAQVSCWCTESTFFYFLCKLRRVILIFVSTQVNSLTYIYILIYTHVCATCICNLGYARLRDSQHQVYPPYSLAPSYQHQHGQQDARLGRHPRLGSGLARGLGRIRRVCRARECSHRSGSFQTPNRPQAVGASCHLSIIILKYRSLSFCLSHM